MRARLGPRGPGQCAAEKKRGKDLWRCVLDVGHAGPHRLVDGQEFKASHKTSRKAGGDK